MRNTESSTSRTRILLQNLNVYLNKECFPKPCFINKPLIRSKQTAHMDISCLEDFMWLQKGDSGERGMEPGSLQDGHNRAPFTLLNPSLYSASRPVDSYVWSLCPSAPGSHGTVSVRRAGTNPEPSLLPVPACRAWHRAVSTFAHKRNRKAELCEEV